MSRFSFKGLTILAVGGAALLLAGCGTASPNPAAAATTASAPVMATVHAAPRPIPTTTTVAASPVRTHVRKALHSQEPAPDPAKVPVRKATSEDQLRHACLKVKKVNGWIFSTVMKHVNDRPGAGEVYAEGAMRLRHVGAGTPIETQVNRFAEAMEMVAASLAKGQEVNGSWLPTSSGPLVKACGAYG